MLILELGEQGCKEISTLAPNTGNILKTDKVNELRHKTKLSKYQIAKIVLSKTQIFLLE